ncbi:peptide chain release factor N(5)-glutamine methyltransferase [Thalassobaculum sp. OXR-137]|uniref:peptide chain release factor N(5)-glutamine methyltransferase n=1 Tax=Thalassobaculum sp. OXR-137 TaxID=3100173 RepID=UPI002AC98AEF|nr:peptide chain release factor N(5)-glutamine methyltransferase [Thalassobaculum sp. OXR-137]WPZ36311.1 peptide chain release factor N(5)-glutamine methyltransferase [Thalassobaculum sp. OXR-137]
MTGIRDALKTAAADLARAGIEGGRLDARLLLGHVLGRAVWPHEDAPLDDAALARFRMLVDRRLAREPVSKIVGRRAFWTLDLAVTADTLDPRPDSETLIESALAAFADRDPPRRILDLGTGTGCLLLAALSEFPQATGLGIDRSGPAAAVARRNAEETGLADRAEIRCQDWSELASDERFDLVLSNPPYIAEAEIPTLEEDVRLHDPLGALVAGADGLEAYRALAPILARVLAPDGVAILELGIGQGDAVAALMASVGLLEVDRKADLAGIPRSLVLKWNDTRSNTP